MTMTCREAAAFVEPYVDGELDVTETTVLSAHVAICGACARLVERQRAWRRVLQQSPRFRAPETLARRVRATLSQELEPAAPALRPVALPSLGPTSTSTPIAPATLKPQPQSKSNWKTLTPTRVLAGLATAAVLLLSLSAPWWLPDAQRNALPAHDLVARDIVASHIRSLMAEHLTDVPSSDRHTVKPWFAGKVPYALSVPDLGPQGFTLEGGRLDYVGGRTVAALVYRRRQHVINLFVWPLTPDARADTDTRRSDGYETIAWIANGQQHWAVSDVNDADLHQFVRLFQQAE